MPLIQNGGDPIHFLVLSITKSAKTTADNLNNPLINLNEEIQRLEKLLKSKKFIFKKQSKHYDLLSDTLDVFRELYRQLPALCLLRIFHAQVARSALLFSDFELQCQ
jgi:hypothetical protein